MNALLASAPLLLRRRGALADVLPVLAFAAATAITGTVIGGAAAFVGRLPDGSGSVATGEASLIPFLVSCAMVASVLLIPSAVGLGGSAARLSLARREQDLATIRLVGGTAGQVGAVAVLDVAAQALLGGLLGVVLHLLVTPPLTALDFGITPFTTADLLMPWWAYPLLVLGMVLLAAGSAAVSLLGVVLSPLGVARSSRTVRMSVMRVVSWAVLVVAFLLVAQLGSVLLGPIADGMVFIAVMILFIGAVVAAVNLVGPYLVWALALLAARVAPVPSLLVGARRLAAAPKAGWRAVSGITFALVIAGFLTVLALLTRGDGFRGEEDLMMATALSTGGLLTLGIAAVLAAVSTGVTQTARVIDQAPLLRAQHVAGAQVGQLHRARIVEIVLPVLLSSVLATFTALLVVVAVLGGAPDDPQVAVQYLASVLGAYLLVIAAVLVGSPLVRRYALRGA
ncbi:FtsX-like permease family protein [Brachybacterium saurashtrense]|uniref:Permease n=1 Tax=Brachybacterium saurashtrense TaxID=556288 RepID=A0A345YQ05_9MICO|nr:FtsX-like permease family protein [Brachybacterium saurashtrense]AXK46007.1 permease [Brachybacterium saurashtrense]RRR23746.1 permease [Brachybacterium saurashtrense]